MDQYTTAQDVDRELRRLESQYGENSQAVNDLESRLSQMVRDGRVYVFSYSNHICRRCGRTYELPNVADYTGPQETWGTCSACKLEMFMATVLSKLDHRAVKIKELRNENIELKDEVLRMKEADNIGADLKSRFTKRKKKEKLPEPEAPRISDDISVDGGNL